VDFSTVFSLFFPDFYDLPQIETASRATCDSLWLQMDNAKKSLTQDETNSLKALERSLEDAIDTLWKCSVLVDEYSDADADVAFKHHL
jgi:hypothetical protein